MTRPKLVLPATLPWPAQARLMAAYAAECQSAAQQAGIDGLATQRVEWLAEAGRAEAEARKYRAIEVRSRRAPPRSRPVLSLSNGAA